MLTAPPPLPLSEWLNRLSSVLVFQPLSRGSLRTIVAQLLVDVRTRLASSSGIELVVADDACDAVLNAAYEPAYGARPLRRYIDRVIVTALAKLVLSGDAPPNSRIAVSVARDASEAMLGTPFAFAVSKGVGVAPSGRGRSDADTAAAMDEYDDADAA